LPEAAVVAVSSPERLELQEPIWLGRALEEIALVSPPAEKPRTDRQILAVKANQLATTMRKLGAVHEDDAAYRAPSHTMKIRRLLRRSLTRQKKRPDPGPRSSTLCGRHLFTYYGRRRLAET
jgi:hypothetical protein